MLDKLPCLAALAALAPINVAAQNAQNDTPPLPVVAGVRAVVMESSSEETAPQRAVAVEDGTESAGQEAIAGRASATPEPAADSEPAVATELAATTEQAATREQAAAMEPAAVMEPAIVEPEGFVPFKCPIERIRDAYQNLVDPEDTLVALAIEKQTLAICRQSQEALILIAENERRLAELFEPIIAPPPPPPPAPGTDSSHEPPSPAGETPSGESEQPSEPEFVPPSYLLAATMKDPQGWKALIADGGATFAVRAGDRMDDGSVVVSIERGRVELLAPDETGFSLE